MYGVKKMDKTKNGYRHLSRRELLELLIEESERTEELEKQLQEAKQKLSQREIKLYEAGSIAEAALELSGVFEAAQEACAMYIENIQSLRTRQENLNTEREAASKRAAERILFEAERHAQEIEAEACSRCQEMLRLANEKIEGAECPESEAVD